MSVYLKEMYVGYKGKWYKSGSVIELDPTDPDSVYPEMYVHYELKTSKANPCKVVIYWRTEEPERKLYELWKYDYTNLGSNSEITHTEKIVLDMKKVTSGEIIVGLFQYGKDPQYLSVTVKKFSRPTVEQLAQQVKNFFRGSGSKYVVRWIDSDTVVLGYGAIEDIITPRVKRVKGSDVSKATLTLYLGNYSRMSIEGPYDTCPPNRTDSEIVRGWESGYEKERIKYNGKYYWFNIPCRLDVKYEDPEKICKQRCFESFKKAYRNSSRTIESNDDYAILDVTDIVSQVENNVESARLTVYFDKPDEVRIKGPYDTKPSSRTVQEIVDGWKNGEEWSRCKCNDKWWWLIVPCELKIKYRENENNEEPIQPPEQPPENNQEEPIEPIEPPEPPEQPPEPGEPGEEEPIEEKPETLSDNEVLLTLECVSKFWPPGIQCMVVGPGVDKYILFKDVGQKETIELEEGKKYMIYTKKRFTLFYRYYEFEAKSGIDTYVGGLLYSLRVKTK